MAAAVAAQFHLGRFPAAQRFSRRRQSGGDAEHVQQPVIVQAEQVLLIAQHRRAEWAVKQAHGLQREREGFERDFIL